MDAMKNLVLPWTMVVDISKSEDNPDTRQNGGGQSPPAIRLLFGIIALVLGIYAGYLCWNCNQKEDMGLRVIYTCIAFANALPYLIYYFFIRYIFGFPCKCCG